jgi:hypothetical protein
MLSSQFHILKRRRGFKEEFDMKPKSLQASFNGLSWLWEQ